MHTVEIPHQDTSTPNLLTTKILILISMFAMGTIGVIAPRYAANKAPLLFSLGNTLAAGILLGAAFLHQLNKANDILDVKYGFPVANLICGASFIILLVIEEAVHLLLNNDSSYVHLHNTHTNQQHTHNHYGTTNADNEQLLTIPTDRNLLQIYSTSLDENNTANTQSSRANSRGGGHVHNSHLTLHLEGSLSAGITLLCALCIHSIIVGLSLGLQITISGATSIGVALSIHKFLAAWSLGVTFHRAKFPAKKTTILSTIFILAAPLGTIVGIALANKHKQPTHNQQKCTAIISAIVAGTFLYIAIVEIGMKEFMVCQQTNHTAKKSHEISLLMCFVLGYAAMAILAIYV